MSILCCKTIPTSIRISLLSPKEKAAQSISTIKPHSLVKQIKKIQIENEYNIDFDLDSLVNEMEKQQKL